MTDIIKPGPKPTHDFSAIKIGDDIILDPLKQSSFKSKLSKFNKGFDKPDRHQYSYTQYKKVIIAKRVR